MGRVPSSADMLMVTFMLRLGRDKGEIVQLAMALPYREKPFTLADAQTAISMIEAGMSPADAGKRIGHAKGAVIRLVKR